MPCVGKAGDQSVFPQMTGQWNDNALQLFLIQVDARSVISRLCRAHLMQNNYRKILGLYSGILFTLGVIVWVNDNLYAQVI